MSKEKGFSGMMVNGQEVPCNHKPFQIGESPYFIRWEGDKDKRIILVHLCVKCKMLYWEEENVK